MRKCLVRLRTSANGKRRLKILHIKGYVQARVNSTFQPFSLSQISNIFNERMFSWGLTPALDQVASTARMAVTSIPQELRQRLSAYVVEGTSRDFYLFLLIVVLFRTGEKEGPQVVNPDTDHGENENGFYARSCVRDYLGDC